MLKKVYFISTKFAPLLVLKTSYNIGLGISQKSKKEAN